jgi:hypothetical protein
MSRVSRPHLNSGGGDKLRVPDNEAGVEPAFLFSVSIIANAFANDCEGITGKLNAVNLVDG